MKGKSSQIFGRGPKTEGEARRRYHHIDVVWFRRGRKYGRSVYEPYFMDVTDALADLLVLALEGGASLRVPDDDAHG